MWTKSFSSINWYKFIKCFQRKIYCVIDTGEVFTWGSGESGQLGLGNIQNQLVPQKVRFSGIEPKSPIDRTEPALDISCGINHTGIVLSIILSYFPKI